MSNFFPCFSWWKVLLDSVFSHLSTPPPTLPTTSPFSTIVSLQGFLPDFVRQCHFWQERMPLQGIFKFHPLGNLLALVCYRCGIIQHTSNPSSVLSKSKFLMSPNPCSLQNDYSHILVLPISIQSHARVPFSGLGITGLSQVVCSCRTVCLSLPSVYVCPCVGM